MRASKLQEFPPGSEVEAVAYDLQKLVVSTGTGPTLRFDTSVGFRVLDEGDLLEFWPACSAKHGGLFEIHDGGWLQQERQRQGFVSTAARASVREFLIVGPNECVNVLALQEPTIHAGAL